MREKILDMVRQNEEYASAVRRHLHMHPELSGREFATSRFLKAELTKLGIPYEETGETSIVATITGGVPGRTVGLRADMDALPIQEKNEIEFGSVNDGVMHACGHDCHMTMLLTAGKILNEMKDGLPGRVKLLFQESEEQNRGSRFIIGGGFLDDVDTLAGLHMNPEEDVGKIDIGYGARSAGGCLAKITVRGQGGHSSVPFKAVNPITVAMEIMNAINLRMAYEFDSFDQVVLTPTMLDAGSKSNIIPNDAVLQYNGRFFDEKFIPLLEDVVRRTAETVAALHGAKADVEYMGSVEYIVKNDDASVDRSLAVIGELFGPDCAVISRPAMFGEDFSFMLRKVPGVFALVGGAEDGRYVPLHNECTWISPRALPYGIGFFVGYALKFLGEGRKDDGID